jgi:hypothetical protein
MKTTDHPKPAVPPTIGGWIPFCRIAAQIDAAGETADPIFLKWKESYGSTNRDAVAT